MADALNLSVLKRQDPSVEEILASGGHVALYDYDTSAGAWQRKDVEGSLFVVRRSGGGPAVVILNKKAGPNWSEPLRPECQFEAAPPYLLTRTAGDAVVGIWFYDAAECDRVGGLLASLAASGGGGGAPPPPPPPPAAPAPAAAASRAPSSTPAKADGFWDEQVTLPAGYDPLGGRGGAPAGAPPPPPPHAAPAVGGPQDPGAHLAALFSGAASISGGGPSQQSPPVAAPAAPPPPPPPPAAAAAGSNPLARLMSKAAASAPAAVAVPPPPPQPQPAAPAPPPPPPPQSQPSTQPTQGPAWQADAVRRALGALLADDYFVEAVAGALRRAGALPPN